MFVWFFLNFLFLQILKRQFYHGKFFLNIKIKRLKYDFHHVLEFLDWVIVVFLSRRPFVV